MDATFEWNGLTPEALGDQLRDLASELQDELESAATDIALRIQGAAARLAPVDTGQLRSSLDHVVEQLAEHHLQIIVGSNAEHSIYQEFGTVKMDAQPYLRPALEEERDWIIGRVETAVETAANNAGFNV